MKSWLEVSKRVLQISSNHSRRGPPQSSATEKHQDYTSCKTPTLDQTWKCTTKCFSSPSSSWKTTSKFLLQSDTEKFRVAFKDYRKKIIPISCISVDVRFNGSAKQHSLNPELSAEWFLGKSWCEVSWSGCAWVHVERSSPCPGRFQSRLWKTASYITHTHRRQSSTNTSECNCICVRLRPTNVLVQKTDESGSHDVPLFAAKLHWRLYPIIHH